MGIAAIAAKAPNTVEVVLSQARLEPKNAGRANIDVTTVDQVAKALAADGDSTTDLDQLVQLGKEGTLSDAAKARLGDAIADVSERVRAALMKEVVADDFISPIEQAKVRDLYRNPHFQLKAGSPDPRAFADYAANFNIKQAIAHVPEQHKALDDKRAALDSLKRGADPLVFVEQANAAIADGNARMQTLTGQLNDLRAAQRALPKNTQGAYKDAIDQAAKSINDSIDAYRTSRQKLVSQLEQMMVENTTAAAPASP